jgi:hypothetical protein
VTRVTRKNDPTAESNAREIAAKERYALRRKLNFVVPAYVPKGNTLTVLALDQIKIVRSVNISYFKECNMTLLGYNPWINGLYAFDTQSDQNKFQHYWLLGGWMI